MSTADFDIASKKYDETFVDSNVGRYQREKVWSLLEERLTKNASLKILELNCGTGADAIFMARKGHTVTATDISDGMLEETVSKIMAAGLSEMVNVKKLDLSNLQIQNLDDDYDLIFSNFGGLNCIGPQSMEILSQQIPLLLKPTGKFIGVIMPSFCWMETMYFLLKLKLKAAFRRLTKSYVVANVDGVGVKTWYYSPKKIKKIFAHNFKVNTVIPIGLFLPPSYLEMFFKNKTRVLNLLNKMEEKSTSSLGAAFADHYWIELQLDKGMK